MGRGVVFVVVWFLGEKRMIGGEGRVDGGVFGLLWF